MRFTCRNCHKTYKGDELPRTWGKLIVESILEVGELKTIDHNEFLICPKCLNTTALMVRITGD